MSNPTHGKWYKFNDTDVQCFDMSDATLEQECFGGSYKAKVYEQCTYAAPRHACALLATAGKYAHHARRQVVMRRLVNVV